MANTDKLAEVTAMLAERDDDFRDLERLKFSGGSGEENVWRVHDLQVVLGYAEQERQFIKVVNLAKTAASKAEMPVREHFIEGDLFDAPGQLFVTKYAAMLIVFNADPNKEPVAVAQTYFALQCDRQGLEDEKRIKSRLDVASENHKLQGVAKGAGVEDFQKFNGMGVSALYGGLAVRQILVRKGLKPKDNYLDFACSEELAANLFRITQAAAALRRGGHVGEANACRTHQLIGEGVRKAILAAGNLPPEALPPARLSIDRTATKVKTKVKKSLT